MYAGCWVMHDARCLTCDLWCVMYDRCMMMYLICRCPSAFQDKGFVTFRTHWWMTRTWQWHIIAKMEISMEVGSTTTPTFNYKYGCFQKSGVFPQNGWCKSWKTLWTNGWFGGKTHHFWKHPYSKWSHKTGWPGAEWYGRVTRSTGRKTQDCREPKLLQVSRWCSKSSVPILILMYVFI